MIRENMSSEGKSKEDLHGQLDKLKQLMARQEEGQGFVHAAIDWGEKACRNTRSDGKEKINSTLKEVQHLVSTSLLKTGTTSLALVSTLNVF